MHLDKEIINLKEIILKLDETYGKPGSSLKRELWSSFNALNEAINSMSSCTELKADCDCNKGKNGEGMDLARDLNKSFRDLSR